MQTIINIPAAGSVPKNKYFTTGSSCSTKLFQFSSWQNIYDFVKFCKINEAGQQKRLSSNSRPSLNILCRIIGLNDNTLRYELINNNHDRSRRWTKSVTNDVTGNQENGGPRSQQLQYKVMWEPYCRLPKIQRFALSNCLLHLLLPSWRHRAQWYTRVVCDCFPCWNDCISRFNSRVLHEPKVRNAWQDVMT
jgi:hypothetical protein